MRQKFGELVLRRLAGIAGLDPFRCIATAELTWALFQRDAPFPTLFIEVALHRLPECIVPVDMAFEFRLAIVSTAQPVEQHVPVRTRYAPELS